MQGCPINYENVLFVLILSEFRICDTFCGITIINFGGGLQSLTDCLVRPREGQELTKFIAIMFVS